MLMTHGPGSSSLSSSFWKAAWSRGPEHGVPAADNLDVLGHQDVHMLHRHQHVTDSLRQDAADAIDRSFPVRCSCQRRSPRARSGGYVGWGVQESNLRPLACRASALAD